jgi:Tfp pilus assembly protein PilX
MKPNCPSRPIASARVQDGVALVMTLILLAVITFLAVTFWS